MCTFITTQCILTCVPTLEDLLRNVLVPLVVVAIEIVITSKQEYK